MSNSKNSILVVIQPSANHYREPFIKELLRSGFLDLRLFGRYKKSDQERFADDPLSASTDLLKRVHRIEVKKIIGTLFWEKGLFIKALKEDVDLYILPGNIYNLTTWALASSLRLRGKRIVFWGHGWKRPESGIKLLARKIFYKLADGIFVYGDWAVEYADSVGLPPAKFFPVYNSFTSQEALDSAHTTQSHLGASTSITLIYSGRLSRRHRVDKALRAVLELRAETQLDIRLIVIGDGPEYSSLVEMTKNDKDAAHFLGAMYSLEGLSEHYGGADYALSPGASGLNVIQALCFNVPVIAAQGDPDSGPELEVIKHEETGYLYPAEDLEALKAQILYTQTSKGKAARQNLVDKGRQAVTQRYTAEQHAEAFIEATLSVLSGERR